jgi:hypothetical protein
MPINTPLYTRHPNCLSYSNTFIEIATPIKKTCGVHSLTHLTHCQSTPNHALVPPSNQPPNRSPPLGSQHAPPKPTMIPDHHVSVRCTSRPRTNTCILNSPWASVCYSGICSERVTWSGGTWVIPSAMLSESGVHKVGTSGEDRVCNACTLQYFLCSTYKVPNPSVAAPY